MTLLLNLERRYARGKLLKTFKMIINFILFYDFRIEIFANVIYDRNNFNHIVYCKV